MIFEQMSGKNLKHKYHEFRHRRKPLILLYYARVRDNLRWFRAWESGERK